MSAAPLVARNARPSSDPDCDHCRRDAHGELSGYSLATYRVQMVLHCLWMWLCTECAGVCVAGGATAPALRMYKLACLAVQWGGVGVFTQGEWYEIAKELAQLGSTVRAVRGLGEAERIEARTAAMDALIRANGKLAVDIAAVRFNDGTLACVPEIPPEYLTTHKELARMLHVYPEGHRMHQEGYRGEWWRLMRASTGETYLESISDRSLARGLCWAYACDVKTQLGGDPTPKNCSIVLTNAVQWYLGCPDGHQFNTGKRCEVTDCGKYHHTCSKCSVDCTAGTVAGPATTDTRGVTRCRECNDDWTSEVSHLRAWTTEEVHALRVALSQIADDGDPMPVTAADRTLATEILCRHETRRAQ